MVRDIGRTIIVVNTIDDVEANAAVRSLLGRFHKLK